ncbi:hypothetical protein [Streptomyces sp. NPDC046978]|uniref:hypothetical protein n=1 Tax=Streptomyces sp. NPDC046978 TaxID=3154704 RepID=UPI0033C945AA
MPEATSQHLGKVRREATEVLRDLQGKNAVDIPATMSDQMVNGRQPKASTSRIWYLNLTYADHSGDVAYEVMQAAVRFPCTRVDPVKGREAMLWAATVTNQQATFNKRDAQISRTAEARRAQNEARAAVSDVLTKPDVEQGRWFRSSLSEACHADIK